MSGMVSIFSLGPLPGKPLLLYISNLPGHLHTVAPLKLKGKTAFLPLSLCRGEWESFKKINTVLASFCFSKGSVFFFFFFFFIDLPCHADKSTLIKSVYYDLVYIKKKTQNTGPLWYLFSPRMQSPKNSPGDWLEIKINTERKDVSHRKKKSTSVIGGGRVGISNGSLRKVDSTQLQNRIYLSLSETFWEYKVGFKEPVSPASQGI